MPRLIVIDNHPLMRDSLIRVMLRARPRAKTMGMSCWSDFRKIQSSYRPAAICLGINTHCFEDASEVSALKKDIPDISIFIFSEIASNEIRKTLSNVAVSAFLEKTMPTHTIEEIFSQMLPRRSRSYSLLNDVASDMVPTSRQIQILDLVSRGMSYRQMARELALSENTIKVHLHLLYKRLNVSGRTQAINYARIHEWI